MLAILRLNVDMKSTSEMVLSIGEVAERFDLATHVLRHWESVGLLAPARAEGSRRRYGLSDLYRVAIVLSAKEAGFGLEDIRGMITAQEPGARRKILRQHRAELARRIAEAQNSLDLIDSALDCEYNDIATCPRFRSMLADRVKGSIQASLPRPAAGGDH
jgi:MerR family copper efflux transcriptional regulator